MPSKILSDLAPELIIQILKSADSFADLTSLSSTSRNLFIIWKTNDGAICEVVLARTVPCYEQIQELLTAQERAEGDEHFVFGFHSAVDRAKWILKQVDTAARALVYYEEKVRAVWAWRGYPVEQAVLSVAAGTDFIRAYYRTRTIAMLGRLLPSQTLSSWTILDLKQVRDVMKWLALYCSGDRQRDLGVRFGFQYIDQDNACHIKTEKWEDVYHALSDLGRELNKLSSVPAEDPDSLAPHFPFIFRDRHHDDYRANRGARLAEFLPLIRERSAYYNVGDELSEE